MVDELGQFGDRAVDIVTLFFQLGDMRLAFLDRDAALFDAAVTEIVEIDHFANFGEREAHVLKSV